MRAASAILIAAIVGCTGDPNTDPPSIAEPTAGQVVDRCLVRARMNEPGESVAFGNRIGVGGTAAGTHADWRVNGGPAIEVAHPIGVLRDRGDRGTFVFATTLIPGANHLELGRCDDVDLCGWTGVDVTVSLGAGSPDCALGGTGQLLLGDRIVATGITPLADGRTLIGSLDPEGHDQVVAVGADGKPDTTFGTDGSTTFSFGSSTRSQTVPTGAGGWLIMTGRDDVNWLVRLDASGHLDPTFGTAGVLVLATPTGSVDGRAIVRTATGGYVIVGAELINNVRQGVIVELDANGATQAITRVGPMGYGLVDATVDPTGNVAILLSAATDQTLVRATVAGGLDPTFGAAGILALPESAVAGAVRFVDGRLVVARLVTVTTATAITSSAELLEISATGSITSLALPLTPAPLEPDPRILLAGDATGALYIASTLARPAEPMHSWVAAVTAGTDVGVVRVRNGAVDPTFGNAGVAHASFELSWAPISVERLFDQPTALAIGPDGAPWVMAKSSSTPEAAVDSYTARGPGVGMIRFMP